MRASGYRRWWAVGMVSAVALAWSAAGWMVAADEASAEDAGAAADPEFAPGAVWADAARRIASRDFPSVFQAWNPADNLRDEAPDRTIARHDLYFSGPWGFGLVWDRRPEGLSEGLTEESIEQGRAYRQKLLGVNPNMILLAEVRYRDAHRSFLPEDHGWWKRDGAGRIVPGWEEGGYWMLDYGDEGFRRHVAARAGALVASGVVDGVMLDWWEDDEQRLALVREVRRAIGEGALILANANDRRTPRTAPYVNGYFMECWRTRTAEDWRRISRTLRWAERNLREPRINCVEFWHHGSRRDERLMRAVTTLTLTHSDGYCLFSDPNDLPTADHLHDWYGFWDAPLGRPRGPGRVRADGSAVRAFEGGTAVFNPMGGEAVVIEFEQAHRSAATGAVGRRFEVKAADGDLFLRAE